MKEWNCWWGRFTVTSIMFLVLATGFGMCLYKVYEIEYGQGGLLLFILYSIAIVLAIFVATGWHLIDKDCK